MRFAYAFRELVRATGLPLDRLDRHVGRSDTALSNYQNGKRLPSEAVLTAVHKVADSPPHTLDQMKRMLSDATVALKAQRMCPEAQSIAGEPSEQPAFEAPPSEPPAGAEPHADYQPQPQPRRPRALIAAAVITVCAAAAVATWIWSDSAAPRARPGAAAPTPSEAILGKELPAVSPGDGPQRVCAETLLVRSAAKAPRDGARRVGTLYAGEAFAVERYSSDGVYAYGVAYGRVRKRGWIDSQWLCAPGETPPTTAGRR